MYVVLHINKEHQAEKSLLQYTIYTAKCFGHFYVLLKILSAHKSPVTAVAFSPDAKFLSSYSMKDNVLLFYQVGYVQKSFSLSLDTSGPVTLILISDSLILSSYVSQQI